MFLPFFLPFFLPPTVPTIPTIPTIPTVPTILHPHLALGQLKNEKAKLAPSYCENKHHSYLLSHLV